MTTDRIFLLLFLIFLVIQAYYAISVFWPLVRIRNEPRNPSFPVSVIICARNEAENLRVNLPFICEQNYIDYEVVVMDHDSTDQTVEVLAELCMRYAHLKYYKSGKSAEGTGGKKAVLKEAFRFAKFDHFLLTDADCRPLSDEWVGSMASHFSDNRDIVLGLSGYEDEGRILDVFIQYETCMTAFTYMGMAKAGNPYMGVGRNLAYDRNVLDAGVEEHSDLLSGDDDLFVQSRAISANTAICTDPKGQTVSKAPETFSNWVQQKRRHYSTAYRYKPMIKLQLLMLKASIYFPNYLFLYLLFTGYPVSGISGIFILRWLIWLILWRKLFTRLHFGRQIYLLPCFEIYFSLFDLWIAVWNRMKAVDKWK